MGFTTEAREVSTSAYQRDPNELARERMAQETMRFEAAALQASKYAQEQRAAEASRAEAARAQQASYDQRRADEIRMADNARAETNAANQRAYEERQAADRYASEQRNQGGNNNNNQSNSGNSNNDQSYMRDQFQFVAPSVNLHGHQEVEAGLTKTGANEPGRVTMHDVDHAAELNRRHLAQDSNNYAPYAEKRLVVDYTPDREAHLARAYDGDVSGQKGSWATAPNQINGKTPDQIAQHLQLPQRPEYSTNVTAPPDQNITRSFVGGSPDPTAKQYRIIREISKFWGVKKL